jgi:hypothetical protein
MENKPNSFQVTLGDTQYTIEPLPFRAAGEVRRQFEAIINPVVEQLKSTPETDLSDLNALATIIETVKGTLFGSMDILLDLVMAYAPNLAAEREKIETSAYDTQVLAAFVEVCKQLFPFGQVMTRLSGLPLPQTPKRSR